MKAKYINPYTDFGFKKIFGEEASKPLLIDFLNALLPEQNEIIDLTFKNTEQLGLTDLDRKAIYDIYCENDKGEKFIVELQKAKQNYFRERTIYYSTFPIREQAEKGEWNYNLKAVYCIGILDFTFDDYETEPERSEVLHIIKLKNQNGKIFYNKLTYLYLEMPNFTKQENELETRLDKWLYFIKNLEDFQQIPTIFKDNVFTKAFEKAELANMKQDELDKYETSLKVFRDNKAVYDYAKQTAYDEGRTEGMSTGMIEGKLAGKIEGKIEGKLEGKLEGKIEGKIEIAKSAKLMGLSVTDIAKLTGLSEEEISKL
ncbi:Rpn family recombination-promoting nuclease/putative transposase [uncultured Mucilaginibacter sp.]|uniref:Rpn family recombination-promoting nuclease/putative transposase n=1 Tax=uncultured Mucilaginibacter sp. TaxID=797541 RepID=UPI00260DC4E3|nr:Rpn family recombination-promoting nuclease/putative transposase [uncultured Mucilaginibacter sp.]